MDLLSQFNNSKRITFENSNLSPLWEPTGEFFGDLRIGKKIGSIIMMVNCFYALEDFSYADFDAYDFTEYLQDLSLDEDIILFFKVLSNFLKNFQPKEIPSDRNSESQARQLFDGTHSKDQTLTCNSRQSPKINVST